MLLGLKELSQPDRRTIIEPHSSSLQFLTFWYLIVTSLDIMAGRSLRKRSTPGHQGVPSLPGGLVLAIRHFRVFPNNLLSMALSIRKSAASNFTLELHFPSQGKYAI
jgi:hypothetical protein